MISETIKEAMKLKKITQLSLASQLGISESSFSLFLNGKSGMRQDKIERAFAILHIKLSIDTQALPVGDLPKAPE